MKIEIINNCTGSDSIYVQFENDFSSRRLTITLSENSNSSIELVSTKDLELIKDLNEAQNGN